MEQYRKLLKLSLIRDPELPNYIRLCSVFKISGANISEITLIFDEFMKTPVDYDEVDKQELLDYLYKISYE